uniref:Uncharacterized protein n=1 Tax=Anguilla anguilla TaxID=7936 RepID=A0A0E9QPC3_ANGAN
MCLMYLQTYLHTNICDVYEASCVDGNAHPGLRFLFVTCFLFHQNECNLLCNV